MRAILFSCQRASRPPASVHPDLLPACIQATPEKKMRPPQAPTCSHRQPIGRFPGAGFHRRLLALRKVYSCDLSRFFRRQTRYETSFEKFRNRQERFSGNN